MDRPRFWWIAVGWSLIRSYKISMQSKTAVRIGAAAKVAPPQQQVLWSTRRRKLSATAFSYADVEELLERGVRLAFESKRPIARRMIGLR